MTSSSSTNNANVGATERPRLCAGRCGGYGNADKDGYCSWCYNPEVNELAKLEDSMKSLTMIDTSTSTSTSTTSTTRSSEESGPPRCGWCTKKLRVTATFACRCKRSFCSAHRLPEVHGCSYNYRAAGKDAIKNQNPICKAEKLIFRI